MNATARCIDSIWSRSAAKFFNRSKVFVSCGTRCIFGHNGLAAVVTALYVHIYLDLTVLFVEDFVEDFNKSSKICARRERAKLGNVRSWYGTFNCLGCLKQNQPLSCHFHTEFALYLLSGKYHNQIRFDFVYSCTATPHKYIK